MNYLTPALRGERQTLESAGLAPVYDLLDEVAPIAYEKFIPAASVLHEFVG